MAVPGRGYFCPKGTLGDVCRRFWLSQTWGGEGVVLASSGQSPGTLPPGLGPVRCGASTGTPGGHCQCHTWVWALPSSTSGPRPSPYRVTHAAWPGGPRRPWAGRGPEPWRGRRTGRAPRPRKLTSGKLLLSLGPLSSERCCLLGFSGLLRTWGRGRGEGGATAGKARAPRAAHTHDGYFRPLPRARSRF